MDDQRLRQTIEKCEALARDAGATADEREAARAKAEKLRAKLRIVAETGDAEYVSLVDEGRQIVQRQAADNWKLGELASRVEGRYGSGALRKYAEEIGVNYGTLKDCRTTLLAWSEKAGRPAFWTAKALNALDDRQQIVRRRPSITQNEARDIAKKRAAAAPKKPKEEKSKKTANTKKFKKTDSLKYFNDLVSIIDGMMHLRGSVVELIREADWTTVHAKQGRQRVLKSLRALRGRVDEEVSRLEKSDKIS